MPEPKPPQFTSEPQPDGSTKFFKNRELLKHVGPDGKIIFEAPKPKIEPPAPPIAPVIPPKPPEPAPLPPTPTPKTEAPAKKTGNFTTPEGVEELYTEDGKLIARILPDGNTEEYDPKGNLIYRNGEKLATTPENPLRVVAPEPTPAPVVTPPAPDPAPEVITVAPLPVAILEAEIVTPPLFRAEENEQGERKPMKREQVVAILNNDLAEISLKPDDVERILLFIRKGGKLNEEMKAILGSRYLAGELKPRELLVALGISKENTAATEGELKQAADIWAKERIGELMEKHNLTLDERGRVILGTAEDTLKLDLLGKKSEAQDATDKHPTKEIEKMFSYTAIDSRGKEVKGKISASNIKQAKQDLKSFGLLVTVLEEEKKLPQDAANETAKEKVGFFGKLFARKEKWTLEKEEELKKVQDRIMDLDYVIDYI